MSTTAGAIPEKKEGAQPTDTSDIEKQMEQTTISHPLQNKWVLWYDNPRKMKPNESWEDNLKKVYAFDTVEEFWSLYNNIIVPSKLSTGSNYHLFKEGVRPMWEDEANAAGGKWVYTATKQKRHKLDDAWMYTVLTLIGETMDDDDDIKGAVVSVRKTHDRIAIWTGTAKSEDLQLKIGRGFRKALDITKGVTLKYQSHDDGSNSGSHNQITYEI